MENSISSARPALYEYWLTEVMMRTPVSGTDRRRMCRPRTLRRIRWVERREIEGEPSVHPNTIPVDNPGTRPGNDPTLHLWPEEGIAFRCHRHQGASGAASKNREFRLAILASDSRQKKPPSSRRGRKCAESAQAALEDDEGDVHLGGPGHPEAGYRGWIRDDALN